MWLLTSKKREYFSMKILRRIIPILSLFLLVSCNPKPIAPDIYTAIENNNLEDVKRFVKRKENLEQRNQAGFAPLQAALAKNRFDIAEFLVQSGALIDCKDNAGLSPLARAAFDGNVPAAEFCLHHKAVVDFGDLHLKTPLMWAARKNKQQLVALLLNAQANIHEKDDHGQTALMLAFQMGNKEVVNYLIARGASPADTLAAFGSVTIKPGTIGTKPGARTPPPAQDHTGHNH
jgi:ankyrin repeat protein